MGEVAQHPLNEEGGKLEVPARFQVGRFLGRRIEQERRRRGLTISEAARLLSTSPGHYRRLERGTGGRVPQLDTLIRVSRAFEVPLGILLRGL